MKGLYSQFDALYLADGGASDDELTRHAFTRPCRAAAHHNAISLPPRRKAAIINGCAHKPLGS